MLPRWMKEEVEMWWATYQPYMKEYMQEYRRGLDLGEVECSDIAMTVLGELVRTDPQNVTENISLALRYADEAARQGMVRREMRGAYRALEQAEEGLQKQHRYIEQLDRALAEAEARSAEAQKLLDALSGDGKDSNIEPKTAEGQRILRERDRAMDEAARIRKEREASQNKLPPLREQVSKAQALVESLESPKAIEASPEPEAAAVEQEAKVSE